MEVTEQTLQQPSPQDTTIQDDREEDLALSIDMVLYNAFTQYLISEQAVNN